MQKSVRYEKDYCNRHQLLDHATRHSKSNYKFKLDFQFLGYDLDFIIIVVQLITCLHTHAIPAKKKAATALHAAQLQQRAARAKPPRPRGPIAAPGQPIGSYSGGA